MSITQHGPICDVGGEYIFGEMHSFDLNGKGRTLHTCDDHKPALFKASEENDWQVLPEGPLRKAYAEAAERLKAATVSQDEVCEDCHGEGSLVRSNPSQSEPPLGKVEGCLTCAPKSEGGQR